jgi:hypothetical protein
VGVNKKAPRRKGAAGEACKNRENREAGAGFQQLSYFLKIRQAYALNKK